MATGVEFLISQGHSTKDVFGYSLRQFSAMLELAWIRVNTATVTQSSMMRMAYHANDEAFEKVVDEITSKD